MRTQLKYRRGLESLREKIINNQVTHFFEEASDEIQVITPQTGSTVFILGLVAQNIDPIDDGTLRVSIRLVAPNEDRGEVVIDNLDIQSKEIISLYYPALRIVGNSTRTFNVDLRGGANQISLSVWFYTTNTTNEEFNLEPREP